MALTPDQGEALWLSRWPEWVSKAMVRHGGRYTYPSPIRAEGLVEVVCPDHGSFWQRPAKHVFGQGCGKCGGKGTDKLPILKELYPEWDWSKVTLPSTTKTLFEFRCDLHGVQRATVNQLMTKKGLSPCPRCSRLVGAARVDVETWLDRINQAWGDEVTLDVMSVGTSQAPARFTCKRHGLFTAILADVAKGHGCSACGLDRFQETTRNDFSDFRELARLNHGDFYEYHADTYTKATEKTKITCPKHGDFWQTARNHTSNRGAGCPSCSHSLSKGEAEIAEYLRSLDLDVEQRVRPLGSWELDIVVPSKKVAIEFCGLYWHGEDHKDRMYHQDKMKKAEALGYRLVTVFCDEWRDSPKKVLAHLDMIAGRVQKIGARKCQVRTITWTQAKEFLNEYHMQGAGRPAAHCYGLFSGDTLLEVATWGTDRYTSSGASELLRLCSKAGWVVVGGLSRLVKRFQSDTGATSLMTYADLRWGTGLSYQKAGFSPAGFTDPGYFWAKGLKRWSRVKFQKHKLSGLLEKFDASKSEVENCRDNGYWRVYDCGHSKWTLEARG